MQPSEKMLQDYFNISNEPQEIEAEEIYIEDEE
jgi:hypothetical protein